MWNGCIHLPHMMQEWKLISISSDRAFEILLSSLRTWESSTKPLHLQHNHIPQGVQSLIKQRWIFLYWEANYPCSLVNMNITFKSWRFNVINIKRHVTTWCNVLQGTWMYYVKTKIHHHHIIGKGEICKYNSTYLVTNLGDEDKFHIIRWWSKVHQFT